MIDVMKSLCVANKDDCRSHLEMLFKLRCNMC